MASSNLSPPTHGTARIDDAAERDDADLGGAAADVDHHRAGRPTPAGRRRSPPPSVLDEEDLRGAGASGDSRIARRSTWGRAAGHADDDARAGQQAGVCTFLMNCLIICSVTTKSAITPSFIGRMAVMLPGVLPSICLAGTCRPPGWSAVGTAFGPDRNHRGSSSTMPCRARRSGCWPCRGRSRDRWRNRAQETGT